MLDLNLPEIYGGKVFANTFSTLQVKNPLFRVEAKVKISITNTYIGTAEIVAMREITLGDLRDPLSYIEAGKPAFKLTQELNRRHNDLPYPTIYQHIVLQYRERDIENTGILIEEWWKGLSLLNPPA